MGEDLKIKITRHARERAYERFKWNRKDLRERAYLALTEGIFVLHDEAIRELFEYSCEKNGGLPYLHEGVVFIFKEDNLITVYGITGRGTTLWDGRV